MRRFTAPFVAVSLVVMAGCGDDDSSGSDADGAPIVVTTSVLGAVVRDVVGDSVPVVVLVPNGTDPHEWRPAPRDVEALGDARLVVVNGLDLEEGLEDALDEVVGDGIPVFAATDHVQLIEGDAHEDDDEHAEDEQAGEDDEHAGDDDEHGHGAEDPHVWMSPAAMAEVAAALTTELTALGLDVEASGAAAVAALEELDAEIETTLSAVPAERRLLVTGHDSLGYLADRYGFEVVGTVIPGLSSQAAPSAGDLADLAADIERTGVPAIFTELGTPASVVEAIADQTGVAVVELPTHLLPEDGTYASFIRGNAEAIADALG